MRLIIGLLTEHYIMKSHLNHTELEEDGICERCIGRNHRAATCINVVVMLLCVCGHLVDLPATLKLFYVMAPQSAGLFSLSPSAFKVGWRGLSTNNRVRTGCPPAEPLTKYIVTCLVKKKLSRDKL